MAHPFLAAGNAEQLAIGVDVPLKIVTELFKHFVESHPMTVFFRIDDYTVLIPEYRF